MGAVSGQYGTVHVGSSELLEVDGWTFSRKAAVHQYATNNTAGHKKAVAGTKSGSGSIKGKYDPNDPVDNHIEEGDSVALKLYTTAVKFYEVPAVIENLDLEVDMNEGEIVAWNATFIADGAWTPPV